MTDPDRLAPLRACVVCGTSFKPRPCRPTNTYCSRVCLRHVPKVCAACKVSFLGGPGQRFCTRTCQHTFNWETVGRLRNRAYVQRVKARKRGSAHEFIDPAKVFALDKQTCRLCFVRVDLSLKHPHPLSATVDHIVPLALGGQHIYTNVQTAHLRCNSRKGITYQGQLPLGFGPTAKVSHWKPNRCACGARCRGVSCRPCVFAHRDTKTCLCGAKRTRGHKGCRQCRITAQRAAGKALRARICVACGTPYTYHYKGQRFCGRTCANKGYTRCA
jgi:5-methylcytosine-specific restriction endonuclease McrA